MGALIYVINLPCGATVDLEVDDGHGRIETSAGGEPSTCDVDTNQEPYEGMDFESEEAARAFYDEYAKRAGFVTRVLSSRKSERDRSIISRGLGCRGGSINRKQDGQREVCAAMILLKREKSGRWVVRKFVRDHNHPLVVQLQKGRRILVSLSCFEYCSFSFSFFWWVILKLYLAFYYIFIFELI